MKTRTHITHIITSSAYDGFATKWLFGKLKELQNKKDKIYIALSGGTTPLPILSDLKNYDIDWEKIVFFMVDERVVELSSTQSNYGNIRGAFYKHISSIKYSMITDGKSINESMLEYSKNLANEVPHKNGFPVFDLMLLGMGEDGHIASLFPETEALNESIKSVVLNHIPKFKSDRITFTFPVLMNANEIVLMIKGKNKKQIYDELYSSQKNTFPISRIIKSKTPITWLIGN